MIAARRTIAVAIHDVEPATFERCALIRDWLDDHGVGRVTLLVIPARDLHPLAERSPDMVGWLIEREHRGDAIAQHGFQHLRSGRARGWAGGAYPALRGIGAAAEAEFLGLDAHETRRAVRAGRRLLKLAGIEPRGFVAPAYAYTPALRQTLGEHFDWWAALLGMHRSQPEPMRSAGNRKQAPSETADGPGPWEATIAEGPGRKLMAPPLSLRGSGRLRHALSPALLRAGALVSGPTLRLDVHPSDLDHPKHMLAIEWLLKRSAGGREAVTYEELVSRH